MSKRQVRLFANDGAWSSAALVMALGTASVMAQSTGATVDGTVKDNSGAPVAGATVTIVNTATNQPTEQKSNDQGQFTLLSLQPGSYRLTIVAGGFKTYEQNGIVLEVGQHATQNVAMQLGKVQETLTVHSDVAGLDTVASTVSDEVNGHSLRNLPLNTRNPYGLAALVPGFQGSTGDDYNSNSVSIDGGRQGYTDTLVDGTPVGFPTVNGNSGVGVIPSVDAIGEYRVQAQNYAAE
jgi:hypothetical protein